jgi:predicted N-acyltransferase
MPLYVKANGAGELTVEDHWVAAYAEVGGRYYPKLQAMVPFTPVAGRRLMAAPGVDAATLAGAVIPIVTGQARAAGLSSLHLGFSTRDEVDLLTGHGFLRRIGEQYHWFNHGYRDFTDFLDTLATARRSTIHRERREARRGDLIVRRLTGGALRPHHWDAVHAFYGDTARRKAGRPYLNRAFFEEIGATMADRVLLLLAERDGRPEAMLFNLVGADALYSRYWGAATFRPFLYFEISLYQAIDSAIALRLARVEGGEGGEYKILRGYEPVAVHSAHWFADPVLHEGVTASLAVEREMVVQRLALLRRLLPFRRGPRKARLEPARTVTG